MAEGKNGREILTTMFLDISKMSIFPFARGSFENMKRAIIVGSALASFCVEKFGTARLKEINKEDLNQRINQFVQLAHFQMMELW